MPNHAGIAEPQHNPWWWDVLRLGRESCYAQFSTSTGPPDADGRILLPVLGSDDDVAQLTVDGDMLRYHSMSFPVAPGTAATTPRRCIIASTTG